MFSEHSCPGQRSPNSQGRSAKILFSQKPLSIRLGENKIFALPGNTLFV
ncbi:Uncharacterized protein dnm_015940 [Desulfonema magnum]|uniref:Uncharacterized protein n=1 Tax=Desulfonema magnum TaxID=45655 RepID=A0A975BHV6_9BACT|nr:Uncharacterized protein dnm_015940 [Desulfonema magnum]